MGDQSKGRTALQLVFLLALIGALISYILPEIFEPFYKWAQSFLDYKVLLTITILLILILLYSLNNPHKENFKNKLLSKRELKRLEKKLKEEHKATINNLADNQKELLADYAKRKTKVLELLKDDGVVQSLEVAGLLFTQNSFGRSWNVNYFIIKDWVWEYIKNHKEEFCIDKEKPTK